MHSTPVEQPQYPMSQSSIEATAVMVHDQMHSANLSPDTTERDPRVESGDGHKNEPPPAHEGG